MKLSLEIITSNLSLLEEVKSEFPIIQDYIDGKVRRESLSNIGLDPFLNLIDYGKVCSNKNLKLIYPEKISYKELKAKISELNTVEKSKKIFLNKSKGDFESLWNNYKLHKRYINSNNDSYNPALMDAESMIFNYLVQNDIEVNSMYMFARRDIFFDKLSKPKYYSRELKTTQDFIESFLNYAKEANLDIRKCNIRVLSSELQFKLKEFAKIDEGLQVKCITESTDFTVDKLYIVQGQKIGYQGFVEILIYNDKGERRWIPYSNFEEVSRQREDILAQLGI